MGAPRGQRNAARIRAMKRDLAKFSYKGVTDWRAVEEAANKRAVRMNPRLTTVPLHADQPREAGLPHDYFEPEPFGLRWFYLLLGAGIGAGACAVVIFGYLAL